MAQSSGNAIIQHRPIPPQKGKKNSSIFPALFICTGISLISGILLTLISATVAYAGKDPDKLINSLSTVSLLSSAFIGGALIPKFQKENAVFIAVLCSVLHNAIIISSGLLFSQHNEYSLPEKLILHLGLTVLYALGAYIFGKGKKKKSLRKYRR